MVVQQLKDQLTSPSIMGVIQHFSVYDNGDLVDVEGRIQTYSDPRYGTTFDCAYLVINRCGSGTNPVATVPKLIEQLSQLDPTLPIKVFNDGDLLDIADNVEVHTDARYGTTLDCAYVRLEKFG